MVLMEAKFLFKVWKVILSNFPISKILNLITDVNFQADDIFQKFPASCRSVDGRNFAAEIQKLIKSVVSCLTITKNLCKIASRGSSDYNYSIDCNSIYCKQKNRTNKTKLFRKKCENKICMFFW